MDNNTFRTPVLLTAALFLSLLAASPAQADATDCHYEVDYVLGGHWMFECESGWTSPIIYTIDPVFGTNTAPCVSVGFEDYQTMSVMMPTLCVDEELAVAANSIGVLVVTQ